MSAYDGPSIFDQNRKKNNAQDNDQTEVDFTLSYEKSLPEDTPSRQVILDDAKEINDDQADREKNSESIFKRPQTKSSEHVLSQYSQRSPQQIDEEINDISARQSSFRPTEIPSIYKNKQYESTSEKFDHQKQWYEAMSDLLSKKPADYILPEASAKKLMSQGVYKSDQSDRNPVANSDEKHSQTVSKKSAKKFHEKKNLDQKSRLKSVNSRANRIFDDFSDQLPKGKNKISRHRPKMGEK